MTSLAEFLDQIRDQGHAFLRESSASVMVSGLSADNARRVAIACEGLNWAVQIHDAEENEWQSEGLTPELEPFRIQFEKPQAPDGVFRLLTNSAFDEWLAVGNDFSRWQIARLSGPIRTKAILFSPWGDDVLFEPSAESKSPRELVREYGTARIVPADVRPWLLDQESVDFFDDAAFRTWASTAMRSIFRSLADELDSDDGSLKFTGPPRLTLSIPQDNIDIAGALGEAGFQSVQAVAEWVFESPQNTEMKHILFATELARSGGGNTEAIVAFKENSVHALEGARIAFQMGLSDLSRDTLKSLSDLRKSVSDETAKLAEITRQLSAAVTGALAIGLGLIAARMIAAANPWILIGVIAVTAIYVGMIVFTGWRFVALQRQLRRDWQPRLYRFLPTEDYDRMVKRPAESAEATFTWTAVLGSTAIFVLTAVVFFVALASGQLATPTAPKAASGHVESIDDAAKDGDTAAEEGAVPEDDPAPEMQQSTPSENLPIKQN